MMRSKHDINILLLQSACLPVHATMNAHQSTAAVILFVVLSYSLGKKNNIVDNIIPKQTIAMMRTWKGTGGPSKGKQVQQEGGAPDSDFNDKLEDKETLLLSPNSKDGLPLGEKGWLVLEF